MYGFEGQLCTCAPCDCAAVHLPSPNQLYSMNNKVKKKSDVGSHKTFNVVVQRQGDLRASLLQVFSCESMSVRCKQAVLLSWHVAVVRHNRYLCVAWKGL